VSVGVAVMVDEVGGAGGSGIGIVGIVGRAVVGRAVGLPVGFLLGFDVGSLVGLRVGFNVVGRAVVGFWLGFDVGSLVGLRVGVNVVGLRVGDACMSLASPDPRGRDAKLASNCWLAYTGFSRPARTITKARMTNTISILCFRFSSYSAAAACDARVAAPAAAFAPAPPARSWLEDLLGLASRGLAWRRVACVASDLTWCGGAPPGRVAVLHTLNLRRSHCAPLARGRQARPIKHVAARARARARQVHNVEYR
jgi:hypothetical protein